MHNHVDLIKVTYVMPNDAWRLCNMPMKGLIHWKLHIKYINVMPNDAWGLCNMPMRGLIHKKNTHKCTV